MDKKELIEILAPNLAKTTGSTLRSARNVLATYDLEDLKKQLAKQHGTGDLQDETVIRQVEAIRAEVRRQFANDPERIRQQQERDREAQETYREYYLAQLFHTAVEGHGVPVRNKASEEIVLGWVNPGETLNRDFLRKVIRENPSLASQLQWQSPDVLDPEKRKLVAIQQEAQRREIFAVICRKHNVSECEANFRLLFDAGLLDSEFTADQAVASNTVTLAQATPQEAAKFHQERVDDYNEALLKADPNELRARVRQEVEQARVVNAQAEADKALAAAQARDATRGGFPPLPPEITSEVIRKATPDQIKFWIKKYSNSNVTARLQNRGQ
jgi:hypothetical protein